MEESGIGFPGEQPGSCALSNRFVLQNLESFYASAGVSNSDGSHELHGETGPLH